MGSGHESACLKRLLPQRIQVLLLPVLLSVLLTRAITAPATAITMSITIMLVVDPTTGDEDARAGGGRRTG